MTEYFESKGLKKMKVGNEKQAEKRGKGTTDRVVVVVGAKKRLNR